MKKIRLISFLALFLCAVMLLVSCGGAKSGSVKELAFKKVIAKSTAEEPATVTIEKLSLEGAVETSAYPFFVVKNNESNTRVVYNVEQNKVVFTDSNTNPAITVNFNFKTRAEIEVYALYFCVKVTDTTGTTPKYQTSLYDASGNRVAQIDGIKALNSPVFDLVSFGGKVYRLSDAKTGTLTEVAYSPLNGDLPGIDAATEAYYYDFSGADVDIYDKNLNLVATYRTKGATYSSESMILKNGNVAVQLRYKLPNTAENYTFISGTDKYLMKTVIVNAKNGKTTDASFNYFLDYGMSLNVDYGFGIEMDEMLKKNIVSYASIYPIVDGILMDRSADEIMVVVDANMKILGRIDAMVDNQRAGTFVNNIYPGYFTVWLANGDRVLLNEKGKVIGNITGAADDDITYSYIYAGGKIFNYALEEVYDYDANGYSMVGDPMEHSAIFTKDSEYFLYINGEFKPIDQKDDKLEYQDAGTGIYVIEDSTDLLNVKTTYYNDKGEAILTLEKGATLEYIGGGDDFGFFFVYDSETSKPTYYRVAY